MKTNNKIELSVYRKSRNTFDSFIEAPSHTLAQKNIELIATTFQDNNYSRNVSNALLELTELQDRSEEFEQLCLDSDPELGFSANKTNLLNQLRLQGQNALEISADAGHYTRYLAENYSSVDAIKLNHHSCAASLKRCRDLDNLSIIKSQDINALSALSFSTKRYELIIIEDLELLNPSENEIEELFKLTNDLLAEGGHLLLNITHPDRAGKQFEHNDLPFEQLYKVTPALRPSSFWKDKLSQNPFSKTDHLIVLPNATNPQAYVERSYLESSIGGLNHFYGNSVIPDNRVNDYLLFKASQENNRGSDSLGIAERCNNSLFVATKGQHSPDCCGFDFLHFSSTSRKRRWRTSTIKKTAQMETSKAAMFTNENSDPQNNSFQRLEKSEYQEGQMLAARWSEVAVESPELLIFEISKYVDWLNHKINQEQDNKFAYDLVPFNIVIDKDGNYCSFDHEWSFANTGTVGFILFRALLWFAFKNPTLLIPLSNQMHLYNIEDFIRYCFEKLDCSELLKFKSFVDLESEVQSIVAHNYSNGIILDALDLPICGYMSRHKLNTGITLKASTLPYDSTSARRSRAKLLNNNEFQLLNFEISDHHSKIGRNIIIELGDVEASFAINRVSFYSKTSESGSEKNSGSLIWECIDADKIATHSDLENLIYSGNPTSEPSTNQLHTFISTSDSPAIRFDLDKLEIACPSRIEIELCYQCSTLNLESIAYNQKIEVQKKKILGLQMHSNELENIVARNLTVQNQLKEKLHSSKRDYDELRSRQSRFGIKSILRRLLP